MINELEQIKEILKQLDKVSRKQLKKAIKAADKAFERRDIKMYKILAMCAVTLVYFLIHIICPLITDNVIISNLMFIILSIISTWYIFFSDIKKEK